MQWQPGASLEGMRARAEMLGQLRQFFAAREVLEVETPVLARSAATDVHLTSFRVDGPEPSYLQTSPEFAMKRLLAAGSGAIYQVCKCFRGGETSHRHNPEFTLLEWYRPGFDEHQLMLEVAELCTVLLGCGPIPKLSYRDLFLDQLGLNPHRASAGQLARLARQRLDLQVGELGRGEWLDLLMSHIIEPQLPPFAFVFDFPAEQAALSQLALNAHGECVARRFELYIGGLELANGYHELVDAAELEARFERDQQLRKKTGLPAVPIDHRLLAAQRSGLPACAGVALGLDRLLMIKTGAIRIDEVLTFSDARV